MLKFVLKALMSVVLDKNARKKLEYRSASEKKKIVKKCVRVEKTIVHASSTGDPLADEAQAIMEALAEARQMIAPGDNLEPSEPDKLRRQLQKRRTGTHHALDQALDSLAEQKKSMTPERKALINGAVALTKMKANVLDNLAPEQHEKLQAMAVASFTGQMAPPKAGNNQ
jgi:hypothetical protein